MGGSYASPLLDYADLVIAQIVDQVVGHVEGTLPVLVGDGGASATLVALSVDDAAEGFEVLDDCLES